MAYKGTKINPQRFSKSQIKFYLILIPISIFMLLPIIYIFNQAFKPLDELFMFPPRFFVEKPTLRNFRILGRTASMTGVPLIRYLFNSIAITSITVISTLAITVMSGYALSKKEFALKGRLFALNQMALMFVPIAVMIPRYLIIVQLGLNNSFWAHILPALAMPIGLFLVKQFIDQIPNAIIEAARVDGATDFTVLFKIVMPLIKPAMATVGILTFQTVWNSVESSNLYVSDETLKTLAFYLNSFIPNTGASIVGAGMAAAAGLIMFLPNLIIFILLQSKVMNTMSHSGIK